MLYRIRKLQQIALGRKILILFDSATKARMVQASTQNALARRSGFFPMSRKPNVGCGHRGHARHTLSGGGDSSLLGRAQPGSPHSTYPTFSRWQNPEQENVGEENMDG